MRPAHQLRELRTAATAHEQGLDEERSKCEAIVHAQSEEADRLEAELHDLTARFCQPLRGRPELTPLFKELELDVAA